MRATQTVQGSTSAPVATTFTVAPGAALAVDTPTDGTTVTVPAGTTATVPVSGRGQAGATVAVSLDGGDPVQVPVRTDGRWSTEVTGLAAGDHTVTVRQVVGGTTSSPVERDLTVVVAEPGAIVVTAPTEGTTYRIVGDTTDVRVTGVAEPGADVSVRIDGGSPVTTTADGDGRWTVTVPGVGGGQHTVAATQSVDGTTSSAPTVRFTVVVAAPVRVTSPTDGQVLPVTSAPATVPVSGTAEPGATVTVDIDGRTATTTAGQTARGRSPSAGCRRGSTRSPSRRRSPAPPRHP